ncbi:hypothetical protein FRACYDRAFT_258727 [Fragilariopsis cylindrus CCMP1102]|uniref:Uncharacterized protein n=1 Tax=Fragilariopsis cylindrus CCMP1102 TaxID=635003 RepID=A0A1E7EIE7_9STRA|nr:hypothetical protein FRACYDRAFT_258727 [Fragilariopsis cylindrus CCMP1102]|eukprot:OEU05660.1 hypothetical protein FRACYDRAFT_258727 [Fragilariopsis cylindrus CCMP1102]
MKARTSSSAKSSKQRCSLIYAFLFGCIVTYVFQHIINTNTNVNRMDALLLSSSSSSFDPPPPTATATKIIYGHLHYIKSAGTNLNGQLASLYQNVCGNKGYSLDYYQYNERAQLTPNITYTRLAGGIDTLTQNSNSSGGSRGGGSSRAQPGKQAVEEIGFESCDYISYECSWLTWPRIVHDLQMKERNMNI